MSEELKPCPLCGYRAAAVWDTVDGSYDKPMRWWVRCASQSLCLLYTTHPDWYRNSEREAIAHWNKCANRLPSPPPAVGEVGEALAWFEEDNALAPQGTHRMGRTLAAEVRRLFKEREGVRDVLAGLLEGTRPDYSDHYQAFSDHQRKVNAGWRVLSALDAGGGT